MTAAPNTAQAEELASNLMMAGRVAEAWAYGKFHKTNIAALHARGWDVAEPCLAWTEGHIDACHNEVDSRIEYFDLHGEAMAIDLTSGKVIRL